MVLLWCLRIENVDPFEELTMNLNDKKAMKIVEKSFDYPAMMVAVPIKPNCNKLMVNKKMATKFFTIKYWELD